MTDSETLLIGDTVVLVIRSRRRTLSLEVGHEGVKARAPRRMSRRSIAEFVMAKQQWIERHLAGLPPTQPHFEFIDGAEILYQGDTTTVRITSGIRKPVYRCAEQIIVPVAKSHLPIEHSAKNKLIAWIKTQAVQELESKVNFYASQLCIPSNKKLSVKVRDYKRRWGSCDHLGQLSFNWRIMLAPEAVLDYVVIHELAHCHEFNHSRRFWQIVAQQMPDYKEKEDWLDTHGGMLYQL